jgi:hypothetical protein
MYSTTYKTHTYPPPCVFAAPAYQLMRHPFSSQITSWETMLLKSETAHLEEKQQRVRAASYYYCLVCEMGYYTLSRMNMIL